MLDACLRALHAFPHFTEEKLDTERLSILPSVTPVRAEFELERGLSHYSQRQGESAGFHREVL